MALTPHEGTAITELHRDLRAWYTRLKGSSTLGRAMPSQTPSGVKSEITREPPASDSAWTNLLEHLRESLHVVQDEIRNYPTPIAGCDQQFNYLLDKRERIVADTHRIREAIAKGDIALATKIARLSEDISEDVKRCLCAQGNRKSRGPRE